MKKRNTTIAPMLSVRNGAKAIEFYKAAFEAKELNHVEDPSGAVVAQLLVGESEIWLADESPENLNFSPESLGGSTTRIVMVADDPDAAFEWAVKAGAKVVWLVADQPYGWRVGRVVDDRDCVLKRFPQGDSRDSAMTIGMKSVNNSLVLS